MKYMYLQWAKQISICWCITENRKNFDYEFTKFFLKLNFVNKQEMGWSTNYPWDLPSTFECALFCFRLIFSKGKIKYVGTKI